MQISVVKPDGENIQKFKEIMQYVYNAYGVQSVEAYIIKEDGELGFLFYGSEMNMYVNNKKSGIEFIAFQLDENGNMVYYGDQEFRIKFDGTSVTFRLFKYECKESLLSYLHSQEIWIWFKDSNSIFGMRSHPCFGQNAIFIYAITYIVQKKVIL